jgi:hypothetical protein
MTLALSFTKWFEIVLISLIVGALGYSGLFFLKNQQGLALKALAPASEKLVPTIVDDEGKPYDYYASQVEARDIFGFAVKQPTGEGILNNMPSGQLPGNFKVVGIILSKPVEVILEDTSAKQTYFVKEGKPQGGISIESVQGDTVFLNYQGQSVQVKLNDSSSSQGNLLNAPFAINQ